MTKDMHTAPHTSKQLTVLVALTQGALIAWSIGSAALEAGPESAATITYILYAIYVGYAIITRNPLMIRLLIICTIAGILELPTDDYLVNGINSLVYPHDEPMIWSSPLYMPLAWANVLIQLGYWALLMARWKGLVPASIILFLAGGFYIPLYEHLASSANWWFYNDNTIMIFNAPVYVILTEALISLSLPYLLHVAIEKNYKWSAGIGIVEGIWIFLSALIAFFMADTVFASFVAH